MMSYLCHRFGHNPNRASPAYGNAKIAISAQSSAHYCTFHSHRRDQKSRRGQAGRTHQTGPTAPNRPTAPTYAVSFYKKRGATVGHTPPSTYFLKSSYYFLESFSFNAANSWMSPRVVFSICEVAGASSATAALAAFFALRCSAFAASSKMRLCERMMRLASLLNSITLNSSVSPCAAVVPSSLTKCLGVAKPSTP